MGDHRGDECGKNGGHQSKAAQRVGAIHGDDADYRQGQIARAGYEAIAGQDQRAAAEALRLFISNTVRASTSRGDSASQRRFSVFATRCGVTQSVGSRAGPA